MLARQRERSMEELGKIDARLRRAPRADQVSAGRADRPASVQVSGRCRGCHGGGVAR